MWLIILLITLSTLLWYLYKKRSLNYWQKRGFPTLSKTNFFFGDCAPSLTGRKSFAELYSEAHFDFKNRGHKVGGIYLMQLPMLMVTDTELMKSMLQTDFEAFAHRGIEVDAINNPLAAHMFSLDGDAWQKIRRKLSPTFTSGKMKLIFEIVEKHAEVLMKVTKDMSDNGKTNINYSDWLDRAGVDVIAHVAFGLDANTLEGGNVEFYEMIRRITRPPMWKTLKMMLTGLTNPANIVALLSSDKELTDFFIKMVNDTISYRRKNNVKANDFLQSLIEFIEIEEKETGQGLTLLEIAAQAFVFFVAGFETTSRTINFALYALAQHQDIQEKVRQEVKKQLNENGGKYTYDWIMTNEYLDMVIKEALRLYPPVVTLNRMSTRDYNLDDLGLTIPKGTCIVFSTFGFHHDPEHFENPMEFNPQRFSKANAENIKPFTNVPFGDGPRFCIGKRFGYMQSKLELAMILTNFQVLKSDETEYPLKISPLSKNLLLSSKDPIYFKFKPL